MNDEQREEIANILRNFKDEGPRDVDVALDAIAAVLQCDHCGSQTILACRTCY